MVKVKALQRLVIPTVLLSSILLTTGCSLGDHVTQALTEAAKPTPVPEVTITKPVPAVQSDLTFKGFANDGKGEYLQTSISDSDPAMKYDPSIIDAETKSRYTADDLAEAQKVIVKFIAEEVIDSTLNGGNDDTDGWFEAHKDKIHPANWDSMIEALKSENSVLARERWMKDKEGYSYVHGPATPRVIARTITPKKLYLLESSSMQGLKLDVTASYTMAVAMNDEPDGTQTTNAKISYAVSKDPTDGKWKISGWGNMEFTTSTNE